MKFSTSTDLIFEHEHIIRHILDVLLPTSKVTHTHARHIELKRSSLYSKTSNTKAVSAIEIIDDATSPFHYRLHLFERFFFEGKGTHRLLALAHEVLHIDPKEPRRLNPQNLHSNKTQKRLDQEALSLIKCIDKALVAELVERLEILSGKIHASQL